MRATKESILAYLKEIKPQLTSQGIVALALFGSIAQENATVYSDIDIAIAKEKDYLQKRSAYSYFDLITHIKSLIQKKFHRNIDIFDLDSNGAIKESIMKDIVYV